MINKTLDWISNHDPRSREYPFKQRMDSSPVAEVPTFWEEGIVLDQGQEGACVGFAWTGELLAEPSAPAIQPEFHSANLLAVSFYKSAQKIDEWAGENYEGTSVLAGAKIMKSQGFIGEYRWCFGIEAVKNAVLSEGPVVLGVPWFSGMYGTLPGGLVIVSGSKVGGHAILLTGYHPNLKFGNQTHEVFRWRNSWGAGYGTGGSGWIKSNDLGKLLSDGGEACVPMDRKIPVFKDIRVSAWKESVSPA
jgi:hypothetical protein